ncbi:flavin reductase [Pseudorhodoferax sp. LjRoot39]|uniref:flavin reductase n=1 Tax=Pseudorhodoferax sp. LjRoot39 TaxID=3342328 RepID=UPI003ECD4E24
MHSTMATVPRLDYRDAMARLGAAVNIITTDGPAGRAGFTASAVCSVTDDPPTLLVCLNRSSSAYAAVHANGTVCVNVLSAGQQAISQVFGGRTPTEERFAAGEWCNGATGAPRLMGAVASLDCRITQCVGVGSHDVLFCQVAALAMQDGGRGLVYFARRYHELLDH